MNIVRLKKLAKKLRKEKGIKHFEALNQIAQDHGYNHWKALTDANVEPMTQLKQFERKDK